MTLHFITTDALRWGTGQERPLTASELDDTIWTLKSAIDTVVAEGPVSVKAIRVVSNQNLWVDLTDDSTFGPFPLPVARLVGKGNWAASTSYSVNDLVTVGGSVYIVLYAHTSAPTFTEGATDVSGNLVYSKMLQITGAIPNGGSQGMVLVKKSAADQDIVWAFQAGLVTPGGVAGQIPVKASSTYADMAWSSSISLPTYGQIDVSGAVILDFANGENQRLNVTGPITSITVNNFGIAGRTSKLALEIWGSPGVSIAWPAGWYWQDGVIPVLGDKAIIVLLTLDGGATIYASVVGQSYKLAGA